MAQAAAGWYDQGDGRQRYWDGAAWTEHFAPIAPPAVAAPPAPGPLAEPPVVAEAPAPEAIAEPPAAPAAPPALAAPAAPAPFAAAPAPGPLAAPPGFTPAVTKKRKVWPWIVAAIGVVVLLIAGAITLFVVVLNKASEGPRDAVHAFDEAWRTGDCAALEATTTEAYRVSTGWDDCAAFQESGPDTTDGLSFSITGFNVTGSEATVTTKERYPDEEATFTGTYNLIKVDGDWKIDSVSLDG